MCRCVLSPQAGHVTMLSSLGGLQLPAYTHGLTCKQTTGSAELMTETQHTSIIVVKYRTTVLFLNPQMLSKHYL